MTKAEVVEAIIAQLKAELASYERSARAAHAEATDEQSKAENKYDTRGLEASYLAKGQSRQAAETVEAMQQFEVLNLDVTFRKVDVGALVELEQGGEPAWYFIGPRAGGTSVRCGKTEVTVLTSASPLGREVLGRSKGDRFQFPPGPRGLECCVLHLE